MSRSELEFDARLSGDQSPVDLVPGVTRLDQIWRPGSAEAVLAATTQWVQSRVLPGPAGERVACLVRAALCHGARFAPRAVTLLVRWEDPMRVRIEVRWIEASYTAEVQPPGTDLGCSTVVFDAFADSWGVGRRPNGWVHWMVVDID